MNVPSPVFHSAAEPSVGNVLPSFLTPDSSPLVNERSGLSLRQKCAEFLSGAIHANAPGSMLENGLFKTSSAG